MVIKIREFLDSFQKNMTKEQEESPRLQLFIDKLDHELQVVEQMSTRVFAKTDILKRLRRKIGFFEIFNLFEREKRL